MVAIVEASGIKPDCTELLTRGQKVVALTLATRRLTE
jgi:hypothetical protein